MDNKEDKRKHCIVLKKGTGLYMTLGNKSDDSETQKEAEKWFRENKKDISDKELREISNEIRNMQKYFMQMDINLN